MPPQTVSLPSSSSPPASPSLTKDAADAMPRIVPVRRTGCWAAAVAVLVLLALAMDSVIRNIAFEAKKGSGWTVKEPADVAGKTISVSSGTNQEKILIEWSEENVKAGRKPVDIKYFQKDTDCYLALQSGRIDAHLGPSPTAAYHVATAGQSEIIGRLSGAGGDLQGKIAATTGKDSGLVKAYAAAIDHIVRDGSYAKVLKRRGLSGEAVEKSEINPPGLPKTKS
ncbi:transporter substrate-binding domain-containing protein [Streptomyces parvus]|uniref:transporter substrate-binding domain-containing protein n=1 Tax=Streptomyces parvus TaxID=66428 RepID=UPI003323F259